MDCNYVTDLILSIEDNICIDACRGSIVLQSTALGIKWGQETDRFQHIITRGVTMDKKCPYCGQTLRDSAFKCSRCKRWVPNELFDRLCDDDVKLIKKNNLIPHTPSLMTIMVTSFLKDSSLKKQVRESFGGKLDRRQQFNLLVFESYCYFSAIRLSAKTKRGYKDTIIATLKAKLLTGIIELSGVKVTGVEHDESTRILRAEGEALYNEFDNIWKDLGTDMPSQVRNTTALASAVYGDKQANILSGLPLYGQFINMPVHMRGPFAEIFLVEEKDFDWQAIASGSVPLEHGDREAINSPYDLQELDSDMDELDREFEESNRKTEQLFITHPRLLEDMPDSDLLILKKNHNSNQKFVKLIDDILESRTKRKKEFQE